MKRKLFWVLLLTMILAAVVVSVSLAQTGSGFDLTWNVIGGGGSQGMAGSGFTLDSTAGQTAVSSSIGSGFDLAHGFWTFVDKVFNYLPITRKN